MTTRRKHSPLWVYLLYLGLVTSLILSMTLARYASTAAGAGTATVAAMAGGGQPVGEPISMLLDNMSPGCEDKNLKFQVVNYSGGTVSEVAMDYEITVSTTGNLPLRFTLRVEAPEGEAENTIPGGEILTGGATTQTLSGGFFPLEGRMQEHTYTLTATWPAEESSAEYADEIDLVTITVEARQRLAGEGAASV